MTHVGTASPGCPVHPSQFKGNKFQQFGGIDYPCSRGQGLGEVPFVAGHKEVSFGGQSTSDELVVIRIRRDMGYWNRINEVATTAEHVE